MTRRIESVLRLDLPASKDQLHTARRAVADRLEDLRTLDRTDLVVLVSELVASMIGGSEQLSLDMWRTDSGFRVDVRGGEPDLDPFAATLLDELTTDWHVGAGRVGFEYPTSALFADQEPDATLLRRAAAGDQDARSGLVDRYRGFARSLSRRFLRQGVSRDDLEQVALIGISKALERFDPGRGVKFTTFAARTIEGELKRHLRDAGWSIRVPRGLQELGLEAARAAGEFSQQEGREPTLDELSAAVERDPDEVGQALIAQRSFSAASLDAPSSVDETTRFVDRMPSHDDRLRISPEWAELSLVLDALPPRERQILYLRFFEDLSQSEIGARVGISQMHVSRLLSKSISTLRALLSRDEPT